MPSCSAFLHDEAMSDRLQAQLRAARDGHARSLAQLITAVENDPEVITAIRADLASSVGHAHVIGITGAPGVGKSTLVNTLISTYREQGSTVAVVAIDPSSPFSGGALLGDRIRMHDHGGDPGVFIRSLSSRGHLGGLSSATSRLLPIFDAAGFDVVIIETVGVGQSEIDVATLADTTVVVFAPGMGDSVQAAKAGIVEIADIFVVTKADREGAEATARDLRRSLQDHEKPAPASQGDLSKDEDVPTWTPQVVLVSAQERTGFEDLREALHAHSRYLEESGEGKQRRIRRARADLVALATAQVYRAWDLHDHDLDVLATKVSAMDMSAGEAARLMREWTVES